MNGILIISHGSRSEDSNGEVRRLAASIGALAGLPARQVGCSFLEIAQPDVQSAVDGLAALGMTDIAVFPHFLACGRHVERDVPREVEQAAQRHPAIRFSVLPHLGALPGLAELIAGRFRESV